MRRHNTSVHCIYNRETDVAIMSLQKIPAHEYMVHRYYATFDLKTQSLPVLLSYDLKLVILLSLQISPTWPPKQFISFYILAGRKMLKTFKFWGKIYLQVCDMLIITQCGSLITDESRVFLWWILFWVEISYL